MNATMARILLHLPPMLIARESCCHHRQQEVRLGRMIPYWVDVMDVQVESPTTVSNSETIRDEYHSKNRSPGLRSDQYMDVHARRSEGKREEQPSGGHH